MARVVILLCALFVCVQGGTLAVKGYYCQDPDTGRLYGVNQTWPSTSFCGNYTCKVRLRSPQEAPAVAPPIVNVTGNGFQMQAIDEIDKKPLTEINGNGVKEVFYKNKELENYLNNVHSAMGQGIDDRYLNKEEIKTIAELLPTVKKSDLEAIIEIYNLAQDIYKEMDSAPPNEEVKDTINRITANEASRAKTNDFKNNRNNRISYWYEPLGINGFRNSKPNDMKPEGSEPKPTSYNPYDIKSTPTRPPTPPVPLLPTYVTMKLPMPLNMQTKLPVKTKDTPQPGIPLYAYPTASPVQANYQREPDTSYFTGSVLTNRDFGRLAYYYPMSNMEKLAYYTQRAYEPPVRHIVPGSTSPRLPCHPACRNNQYVRLFKDDGPPKPTPHKPAENRVLLPIPFTFQTENGSANPSQYNNYYKGNPWELFNFYRNNPSPYQTPGQPQGQNNVILPDITDFQNEELKPIDNIDDEKLVVPAKANEVVKPWQTDPLEQIVIEEIRANILERAKLLKLPFKKRIKLDRVAKVINLDHLNRSKRHADVPSPIKRDSTQNNEPYEVYLEKTTCMSTTEPGFFRVGNLTEPFPACCPQKIEG